MNTINGTDPPKALTNLHRIPLVNLASSEGYSDVIDYLEAECSNVVVRACCDEGCEVEPDGTCEHGCPSALLAAGVI